MHKAREALTFRLYSVHSVWSRPYFDLLFPMVICNCKQLIPIFSATKPETLSGGLSALFADAKSGLFVRQVGLSESARDALRSPVQPQDG